MVSILSPGVYLIEKDLSIYPPSIGAATVGIVGFATKGPVNRATLITSAENLIKNFGQPDNDLEGHGIVGALEILETTNSLYYVRACDTTTAKSASATIGLGCCPAIAIKSGSYGVNNQDPFGLLIQVWDNNGTAQFTTPGKYFTIPSGTANSQQEALAKVIGQDVDTLKVTAQFPYTKDGDGRVIPGSIGADDAGIIVGAFAGAGAKLYVSASVANILYPLDQTDGSLGTLVTTNETTVSGFGIETSSLKYTAESLYPGTGYNLEPQPDGSLRGNSLEVTPLGGSKFTVVVNEDGGSYETFMASLVNKNGLFLTDVINTGVENATSEIIKGNFYSSGTLLANPIRLTSFEQHVSGIVGEKVAAKYGTAAIVEGAGPRFAKLIQASENFTGGNNGVSGNTNWQGVIIGDAAEKSGVYALDDDILNLTVGLVPGVQDDDVQNALITLAEQTGNFLAVVSPPQGLNSVQEAIDWSNGFGGQARTSAINSSYAAIYWPHVQTFVPALGMDMWIDPAVYGARQIVYTASVSELWFAPAGFIRGRLTKPTAVEVQLGQGDRDAMYSGGNAINPIVNFPQQGITIFGQRTAQRNPTALDRINVRLLSIYLKKTLLASVRSLIFEPNDPILWEQITDITTGILTDIKNRRGITAFQVVCDETTNTPVRVDRNELWCKVVIQPTKTAEAIVFELNLTSQSGTVN